MREPLKNRLQFVDISNPCNPRVCCDTDKPCVVHSGMVARSRLECEIQRDGASRSAPSVQPPLPRIVCLHCGWLAGEPAVLYHEGHCAKNPEQLARNERGLRPPVTFLDVVGVDE